LTLTHPAPLTASTIATQLAHASPDRWRLIRLLAATMVVFGHSFALAPAAQGWTDPVQQLLPGTYSGALAVEVFFFISGLLISHAVLRTRSLASFAMARALRVLPGFWVMLLVTTALVGCFSTLGIGGFWRSAETYQYLIQNAALWSPKYTIAGVFDGHAHTSINGSLWSLFLEVKLYLASAALVLFPPSWRRPLLALGGVVLLALTLGKGGFQGPQYGGFSALGMYAFGMLVCASAVHFKPRGWWLVASLVIAAGLAVTDFAGLGRALVLLTGLLYLIYRQRFALPQPTVDLSYGLFLYSFPIQQSLAVLSPESTPYVFFALSMLCTLPVALASWRWIERPALNLKHRFAS
jgi:peptidoglycan/LPS O-acetylase OafA/YrhL